MTTSHFVVYSSNMKANQIFKRRVDYGDSKIADMVIWEVPQPVQGSPHAYKYRVAVRSRMVKFAPVMTSMIIRMRMSSC